MKKILSLLLAAMMILCGCLAAGAEGDFPGTAVAYEDLPQAHRALYESEMESALANVRARTLLQTRGLETGYKGTKNDNSLVLNYDIRDSMVEVGQYIYFAFDISTIHDAITYTIGGAVLDENFKKVKDLLPEGEVSRDYFGTAENGTFLNYGFKTEAEKAGYVYFILVVSDSNGNQVALTTPTVQIYENEVPEFDNIGTDTVVGTKKNLGVRLTMDATSAKVGDEVTASVTMNSDVYPIEYSASWTHIDAAGNELVVERYTGTVEKALDKNTALTFPYQPLMAGKIQFLITATDGNGNTVTINNPQMTVADGYYVTLALNTAIVNIGGKARANYRIEGHECEDGPSFRITWRSYAPDAALTDEPLQTQSAELQTRSGSNSFIPRMGQDIICFVDVACKHTIDGTIETGYAEASGLVLVGGISADLEMAASTVASGDKLAVTYSVEGGISPYKSLTINGYSVSGEKTFQFLSQTVEAEEGTVSGRPYLGNQVYYEITVVEADGFTTTWRSDTIPMTGSPYVSDPVLTASLNKSSLTLGESMTLTYQMTGGSGTVGKEGENLLRWTKADGTVVNETKITAISGTSSFTPSEGGEYRCEIRMTDGYNQSVTWTSSTFNVSARLPGDANGDGKVDVLDPLLIMKQGAGWNVSLNNINADVNASGSVNIQDALLILKYISGESVTLK